MYPIAWATVDGENNDSWEWFFIELKKCLELDEGNGVALIFDEHHAVINAVANVLPHDEHRHYAMHIFPNWHKFFKRDEMKILFWKTAKAYNIAYILQ